MFLPENSFTKSMAVVPWYKMALRKHVSFESARASKGESSLGCMSKSFSHVWPVNSLSSVSLFPSSYPLILMAAKGPSRAT